MKLPNFLESATSHNGMDWPQKVARLATLPDHFLVDCILPRLPVKSLLRFKSVCRFWRSIISTPEFAKLHLAFSRPRHQFVLLLRDLALLENPNFRVFKANYKCRGGYVKLHIAGSSNGLVGFAAYLMSNLVTFFVLNPATGQRVQIAAPEDEHFESCMFWFGYVSSMDDYKIAAFNSRIGVFWTYSLKAGIWKRISGSIDRYCGWSFHPVLINDCLYWSIDLLKDNRNKGTQIVKLNVVSEEYEVKPQMNFAFGTNNLVNLVNLKGCLALHTTSFLSNNDLDVWVLKDIGDWNSWEKVYSKVHRGLTRVYISTTGKLLVHYLKHVKVLNDLSQIPLEEEEESNGDADVLVSSISTHGVGDYFESLISPFFFCEMRYFESTLKADRQKFL